MAKRLWSLSGIAAETGRNFRTCARALERTKPDGKSKDGKPRWLLATAIAALAERERQAGRVPHRPVPERFDAKLEAQIAEIEESGKEVDALLAKLRGEKSIEARRALVESGAARVVGSHERALAATIGDGASAPLRRVFCDSMMERITSELLALCEWRVADEAGVAA
jgi:hypothetical protein